MFIHPSPSCPHCISVFLCTDCILWESFVRKRIVWLCWYLFSLRVYLCILTWLSVYCLADASLCPHRAALRSRPVLAVHWTDFALCHHFYSLFLDGGQRCQGVTFKRLFSLCGIWVNKGGLKFSALCVCAHNSYIYIYLFMKSHVMMFYVPPPLVCLFVFIHPPSPYFVCGCGDNQLLLPGTGCFTSDRRPKKDWRRQNSWDLQGKPSLTLITPTSPEFKFI